MKIQSNFFSSLNIRYRLTIIHFFLTTAVFLIVLTAVKIFWFPGYTIHFGGTEGLIMFGALLFASGPPLTMVVADPNKKVRPLILNLVAIVMLQSSILTFGLVALHSQRPVALIVSNTGLHVYTFSEFESVNIPASKLDSFGIPIVAFLDLPNDTSTIKQIRVATEIVDQVPLEMRTDLYIPPYQEIPNYLLNSHNFDAFENCYAMKVYSSHYKGMACIDLTNGSLEKLYKHSMLNQHSAN